ncbi:MAG: hypothetical protein WDA16_04640 [Candidatus Thermoplasmatota archaeon]
MTELPLPTKQKKADRLEGAPLRTRETEDLAREPMAAREHERLAPGGFFAEHKALVDERRVHLQRLGMDERHVNALRMPERHEQPLPMMGQPAMTPVTADVTSEPETLSTEYAPKRLDKKAPMRHDLEE